MTTFATQATTALEEALRLVDHDYALTPVTITREPSGKKKARFHRGWRHEEAWSRDPDQIRAWWVDHPDTSFALGCAVNDIEGVDLDVKPAEGIDSVSSWAERGLPLGRLLQNTPSGGLHSIWAVRRDGRSLPQEAGKSLGRGIDTRNRSGLFFAAGAYILGEPGNYEISGELPHRSRLTPTPDEVVDLFTAAAQQERVDRPDDGRIVTHQLGWQQDMVAAALGSIRSHDRAEGGYRVKLQHAGLFLGRVVEQGLLSQGEAISMLTQAHMSVWGPALWPENVKDIRDAIADGPRLERWRAPDATPESQPIDDIPDVEPPPVADEPAGEPGGPGEPEDPPTEEDLAARVIAREVAAKVRELRIRDLARRAYLAENAPPSEPAGSTSLRHFLAEPRNATKYRIDRLWPSGGKIMLTAQKKTGKTTLLGNLIRSLADGVPFLAKDYAPGDWRAQAAGFQVAEPTGRPIVLLDFEMTHDMLAEWLGDQRIRRLDGVHVRLMRGHPWDIRDDDVRSEWATYLRSIDAGTLLVDPIGPVLGMLGINEDKNSEVNQFLSYLDRLAAEAGLDEHGIVQHAGHGEDQRARGASAFLGWPDATWQLIRDGDSRYLAAEGRDVFLPETTLAFDRATRRLSLGEGNRAQSRASGDVEAAVKVVEAIPGMTRNAAQDAVRDELTCGTARARAALVAAVKEGRVHRHEGANRSQHHFPGVSCDTCTPGEPE